MNSTWKQPYLLLKQLVPFKKDTQQNRSGNTSDVSPESREKIRILLVITRLTIGGDTNVVLDIASYFHSHPDFEAHLAVGPVPENEIDVPGKRASNSHKNNPNFSKSYKSLA